MTAGLRDLPADFDGVLDRLNAIQFANGFLSHLFLEVGVYDATKGNVSFMRFETKLALIQVWGLTDRNVHAIFKLYGR